MGYKKSEEYDEKLTASLMEQYQTILKGLGEDLSREGLLKTPERVAKAMQFLTQGYAQDAEEVLHSACLRKATAKWSS